MDNAANEEVKTWGKPKKSLGTRGPPRQPPPSEESGMSGRRTKAVFRARKNPEENELVGELEEDLNMASAVPSKKRRYLKVSRSKLTASE